MTSASVNMRPGPAMQARQVAASAGAPAAATVDPIKIVKKYKVLFIVAGVAGVGIGIVGQKVLERVMPIWRSTMMYQVLPITQSVSTENTQIDREEFDRYAATQARVVVADRVIRDAIDSNLDTIRRNTEWGKRFYGPHPENPDQEVFLTADAVRDLKDRVTARVVAGTQLMEVIVSSPVPDDALQLANFVHQAYFRDLTSVMRNTTIERTDPLRRQIDDARAALESRRTYEIEIMKKVGMTSLKEEGQGEANREAELNRAMVESSQALKMFEAQRKTYEDQVRREGGIVYTDEQRELAERDPIVMQLKQRVVDIRAEDQSLANRGYGENQKDRSVLRSRLETTENELNGERAKVLEKLFNSDLDKARRQVEAASARLNELAVQRDEVRKQRAELAVAARRLEDVQMEKQDLMARLKELEKARDDVNMLEQLAKGDRVGRMRRIEVPRKPDEMSFPRLQYMIPLGIILATGLTAAGVVLRELLDQRVRGPADIGVIPRLRLLGVIPDAAEDPTRPATVETAFRDAPTGAVSEAFRQARASITKRLTQTGHKSILVMAGAPGSGATTTAANLAMGYAASDMRVLLIDGNFRRPNLHRVLKVGDGPGLGDVLSKKSDFKSSVQQTSVPNLWLLAAGSAASRSVPERLSTPSMNEVMREAQEQYDLVIIDTAPGMVAGDGLALANKCDATIMVVRAGSEKRGLVARLRDQISDSKSEFMGVIVNAVRASAGGYMKQNIRTSYEYSASAGT